MEKTELKQVFNTSLAVIKTAAKLSVGGYFAYYFLFLIRHVIAQKRKKNPLPPGPAPLPVIGSLHLMARKLNPDGNPAVHKVLMDMGKEYKGLFGLYFGSVYTLVVTDPAVAEEAYSVYPTFSGHEPQGTITTDRASRQSDGKSHVQTMKLFTRDGQGIAMSTGAYWQRVRGRCIANITHKKIAQKNEHIVQEEVQSVIAHWVNKVNRGEPLDDLLLQLKRESLNIGFRLLFSRRYPVEHEDIKLVGHLISYFFHNLAGGNPADVMPVFGLFPSTFIKTFKKKVALRDEFIKRIIDEHLASFNELRAAGKMKSRTEARDVCDMFLFDMLDGFEQKDPDTGKFTHMKLTRDEVEVSLWDIIFAFGDTTPSTNQNLIFYLINNPRVQDKVHEELDRVVGDSRLPTFADKENMPYMWAALKEVFRIRIVSPIMAPHYNKTDIILHDTDHNPYFIPKGTSIFMHGYSMALDEKYWEKPEEFIPERWFNEENLGLDLHGQEKRSRVDHYKFIPFSMGPRMCPGYALAKITQFIQAANLLHAFKFKLSENAFDIDSKSKTKNLVGGKLDTTENFGLSNFLSDHGAKGLVAAEIRKPAYIAKFQPDDVDYSNKFLTKNLAKPASLVKRINLDDSTSILRFSLGSPNVVLGCPGDDKVIVALHPKAPASETRLLKPETNDGNVGYVDFRVKFTPKDHFTDALDKLLVKDCVYLQGSVGGDHHQ